MMFQFRRRISEFIIDETLIKEAGSVDYLWLGIAIGPNNKMIS
jgi:hypothetical protein